MWKRWYWWSISPLTAGKKNKRKCIPVSTNRALVHTRDVHNSIFYENVHFIFILCNCLYKCVFSFCFFYYHSVSVIHGLHLCFMLSLWFYLFLFLCSVFCCSYDFCCVLYCAMDMGFQYGPRGLDVFGFKPSGTRVRIVLWYEHKQLFGH
jgi:hypothetical protein